MEYKCNNSVTYSCKYHLVWCAKYRRRVLVGEVAARLKEIITAEASGMSAEIKELDVRPDHIYIWIEIDPQHGIHRAVKQFKRISSIVLRNEFPPLTTKLPSLWTNAYFVSTEDDAPVESIKRYIESQRRDQRKRE